MSNENAFVMGTTERLDKNRERRAFASRLFVVAALTLGAAYYVPLVRTHEKLVSEYRALAQAEKRLEGELSAADRGLMSERARAQSLAEEQKARESASEGRTALLSKVQADLAERFAPRIEAGDLRVVPGPHGLRVSFSSALTSARDHFDVSPAARGELCEVASMLAQNPLVVTVVASGTARETAKASTSSWDLAGSRAAAVARTLSEKCRYPSVRVRTETSDAGPSVEPDARSIELRIEPEQE